MEEKEKSRTYKVLNGLGDVLAVFDLLADAKEYWLDTPDASEVISVPDDDPDNDYEVEVVLSMDDDDDGDEYGAEDAPRIIWDFLAENDELNELSESLIKWFGDDEIVDWFYRDYCVNQPQDVLDGAQAKAVEAYFNNHCRQ